jgi:hypothetical protein
MFQIKGLLQMMIERIKRHILENGNIPVFQISENQEESIMNICASYDFVFGCLSERGKITDKDIADAILFLMMYGGTLEKMSVEFCYGLETAMGLPGVGDLTTKEAKEIVDLCAARILVKNATRQIENYLSSRDDGKNGR